MFGLSFLNSVFLLGMAAAAIPLIIHLIKRNRAVKLPFAAMRFLQIRPDQKVKSQKLRQFLLLLMRMTALALLALAFARPFLENADRGGILSNEPEAAVILVDNSFSMAHNGNFDKAIAKTKELLRSFEPGDKVSVMQFSENISIVAEADREFAAVANQLPQRLALSNQSTNYAPALQAAESYLLESPFETKTIFLVSDLQKHGFDNIYSRWQLQPGIRLETVAIEHETISNVAIKEVLISDRSKSSRTQDVLVKLKNFGNEKKKTTVTLILNNKNVSKKNVSLLGGEEDVVQLTDIQFPRGLVSGFAVLQADDDDLTQDNQFFFVLENESKTQILAVNGEPDQGDVTQDELFFVERAINLPRVGKYNLVHTVSSTIDDHNLSKYRAVLLANIKDLSRDTVERLGYFVRSGGGLIVSLGDQVNPTIFNRLFRDLAPAELTGLAFKSVSRDNSVILAEVDYQHPIFRVFSDPGHGDPSIAQFYQYYQADPVSSGSVLAHFDDDSPAIIERKIGSGKVILFTSSLDSEWSNLPVKAIFLPILYQTLDYAASEKKGQEAYIVGQPVTVTNFAPKNKREAAFYVESPAGEVVDLENKYFKQTDEPGIYRIKRKQQNRTVETFAINIDSRESDLTSLSLAELREKIARGSDEVVQTAAVTSPKMNEQLEDRQKLWRLAILAVILLLLGETWLANRTYR
ncbi:VWA domain-containing protein [candidate division KSB1 bacterium]|nr:VWA domain-containing protein [candidate division KSB1 bacterium]NIR70438.1 VWA domain-containing protein [candidate division KSB1 bacterium]NIS23168.1 VWA domain-containing protein [candidate division KSB1 bacterium]NIT70027.1 VWA domain-containing protein [candidate division KSB1 bacterium]NIU23665.1 VWA domain-containing protein [candidate division KSB1 bacterium]